MMAITKQSYKDLKEYWDYQRKVEYNKEIVYFVYLALLATRNIKIFFHKKLLAGKPHLLWGG